jgi:hypothetical protein
MCYIAARQNNLYQYAAINDDDDDGLEKFGHSFMKGGNHKFRILIYI